MHSIGECERPERVLWLFLHLMLEWGNWQAAVHWESRPGWPPTHLACEGLECVCVFVCEAVCACTMSATERMNWLLRLSSKSLLNWRQTWGLLARNKADQLEHIHFMIFLSSLAVTLQDWLCQVFLFFIYLFILQIARHDQFPFSFCFSLVQLIVKAVVCAALVYFVHTMYSEN